MFSSRRLLWVWPLLGFALGAAAADAPFQPSREAIERLRSRNAELAIALQRLDPATARDLVDDVAIYQKAVDYILRFPEQFYKETYYADALELAEVGLRRAEELQRGAASWPAARGPVCRAYLSTVDGSLQPYIVWVPDSYDPA